MVFWNWPYGEPPGSGVWGTPTSNHNFCEEDYIITPYIGEFINTLTNITYVIYGTRGLIRVQPRKDGGLFSTLAFPYWGLIGVGVLSGWYHATLNYHSQMGDDLSMLLASGSILQQVLTFNRPPGERIRTTLMILFVNIAVSVYHCWADEIIMHEILFAIMVFMTGRNVRRLIHERIKTKEARNRLFKLANIGSASGVFGYGLWSIDYHLCSYVTQAKRSIGLPWGFILELHGWWHIFTGIGAYIGMSVAEYLVTMEEGQTGRIEEGFAWPCHAVLRDLEDSEVSKKSK
ncbi:alkaline ceramidase-like protein [Polyplosphaeria fusca]|uniref:Alkaline ceramidase-like protein n=1 Tax=Polyplosphaeria fusca TaxID=682080 RepID=A0A9P4RAY4_9PLEO|nr:alkaline ceramidase-like protein [Polyplosphaeria fusca]